MIIRLNEAELLRAGMPRDAVAALRKILQVIGDGIQKNFGAGKLTTA